MRFVARFLVSNADECISLVLLYIIRVIVIMIVIVVVVMVDHQAVTSALVGHWRIRGRVRVRITVIPIIRAALSIIRLLLQPIFSSQEYFDI